MLRQVACLALVLTGIIFGGALPAWAQGQSSSLSDRLEQFRDDLVGSPDAPPVKKKRAGKPVVINGPTVVQGEEVNSPVAEPPAAGPPASKALSTSSRGGAAGTSSRRTAQPSYKPGRTQAIEPEAQSEPTPAIVDRQESAAVEEFEEAQSDLAPSAMPMPRMARGAARKSEPVAEEGDTTVQPEPVRPTRVAHKPGHLPVAAGKKEVLMSGRTAALAIEAHGPSKVTIGREATFKVMLQNTSEVAAHEVMVHLDIPAGAEIVDIQTSAGASQAPATGETPAPLVWQIPHVAAKSHEMLTLKLIPRQNKPIDLAVRWTCLPEMSQASVEVQEPKLAMSLSGPEEVLYGQSRAYRLTISNPGSGDAENVVVSLTPIGRSNEPPASHRLGTLPAGGHKMIEVELTARQAGELQIKAQVQGEGGLSAEVAQAVLVRRANLHLDVEGPKIKYSGTKGTYRIRLVNGGNAVAEAVHVSAALPSQATYHGSSQGGRIDGDKSKVVWTVGSLQPGEERLLELQCVLQSPGENKLQVETNASQDLLASAGTVTLVESLADLKLEVHDPPGPIATGEDTVYEVVVRNRGTKVAENVDLLLFFSEGLEATAVHGGAFEIGPGQVVIKTMPSLAAGAEKTFKIHTRADRAGNHIFRAEVVCAPLEIKLTSEQATRFYGDDSGDEHAPMVSRRPGKLQDDPDSSSIQQ
jgi:Domain of unknown function DUF11